jgi:uncharacterized protein with ParB-like and HNH nuclease domain
MDNTKPIIDLFGMKFNIPHYQRGYRWEKQEVVELLDDLWSFYQTAQNGEFYCLQPIVVQNQKDGIYDVLDGQQRLTTLYLILSFLEERRLEDGYQDTLFELKYETRKGSENFLAEKKFKSENADKNIDFYHICNAFEYIRIWFSENAGTKGKITQILMDRNGPGCKNVRVIWYEVERNLNPIDIFIRLNVGKIPLTDAELIKALLLQKDKYQAENTQYIEMELFKIAAEWDTIEYKMQEDAFWYFLSNQINEKASHIEFIFDLLADQFNTEHKYFNKKPSKHATFLILSEHLKNISKNEKSPLEAVISIWYTVVEYFERMKEWYEDRKLYHYIGFIISQKDKNEIKKLVEDSAGLTKTGFEIFLINEIFNIIKIEKIEGTKSLKDLSYERIDKSSDDKRQLEKILLLHNIIMTQVSKSENARFPFYLYKGTKQKEKWSLEHIHAQNSEILSSEESIKSWLEDHLKSLSKIGGKSAYRLIQEIESLLVAKQIDAEIFNNLFSEVIHFFDNQSGLSEKEIHSISNLCLLDKHTNSVLNNSVFDVKREKIKKRELQGHYIPISTRNVFLKYYTDYPKDNAYWTKEDRNAYFSSIEEVYNFFKDNSNQ